MFKKFALAIIGSIVVAGYAHAQTGSTKTQAQLDAEINAFFPDQNPGAGLINPFNTRQTLLDMVASTSGAIPSGSSCSGLTTPYQFFANTTGAPTDVTLNIYDGSQCVQWAALNTSSHVWSFITNPSSAATGTASGLTINSNGSGTGTAPFSYDSFNVTDNIASSGTVDGLSVFMGIDGSAVNSARQAFQSTMELVAPTSASNTNRNYVAGVFTALAMSGDGGGSGGGQQKGSIFAINPSVSTSSVATNLAETSGGEVDLNIVTGSSTLDKYGWKITEIATDAVQGSRNDAALFMGSQSGAVGWGTLWQVGDGLNQNPLLSTGSVFAFKGTPTIANGFDLSGAGSITGCAFKALSGFCVNGTGGIKSGAVGGTSGSLQLLGLTSGSFTITASATGSPQYGGTATNDNAPAGDVGEYISSTIASGSAVSLSNGSPSNLTSISLTAGDWDVTCETLFSGGTTTPVTTLIASLSGVSAGLSTNVPGEFIQVPGYAADLFAGGATYSLPAVGPMRFSFSVTTTVYCVAQVSFTPGTVSVFGLLRARRVR